MGRLVTQLQQELGFRVAARIIEIAGGERISIPGRMENNQRLRARFGDEIAVLLVLHYGDSWMFVPTARHCGRLDDDAIRRMTDAGRSANQIARELRCTVRAVWKSRARSRASRHVMGMTLTARDPESRSASFTDA